MKDNSDGENRSRKDMEPQEEWEALEDFDTEDLSEESLKREAFSKEAFQQEDLELEDDLQLEENIRLSPRKIAVFCGMFLLAVLICIPLWNLTHKRMEQEEPKPPESQTEAFLPETADGGGETGQGQTDTQSGAQETFSPGENAQNPPETSASQEDPAETQGGLQDTKPAEGTGEPNAQTPSEGEAGQNSSESKPPEEPDGGGLSFTEISDQVTAKDVTNLRSTPSTLEEGNVVGQLKNGESLERTGYNDSAGWSRLIYNGETVYAVTRYLTTDLSYQTPAAPTDPNRITTIDGRVILFTDCDDYITPKEYVNLRTEPSTSQGEATVRCQVKNGESVHRTGYSEDSGWSRVEYNGETLYVVTSYVVSAAAE